MFWYFLTLISVYLAYAIFTEGRKWYKNSLELELHVVTMWA